VLHWEWPRLTQDETEAKVSVSDHDSLAWWSLCNIGFSTSEKIFFAMGGWGEEREKTYELDCDSH